MNKENKIRELEIRIKAIEDKSRIRPYRNKLDWTDVVLNSIVVIIMVSIFTFLISKFLVLWGII